MYSFASAEEKSESSSLRQPNEHLLCLKENYTQVRAREGGIKSADDSSHIKSCEVNESNDIEKPELRLEQVNTERHDQAEQCARFDWDVREISDISTNYYDEGECLSNSTNAE